MIRTLNMVQSLKTLFTWCKACGSFKGAETDIVYIFTWCKSCETISFIVVQNLLYYIFYRGANLVKLSLLSWCKSCYTISFIAVQILWYYLFYRGANLVILSLLSRCKAKLLIGQSSRQPAGNYEILLTFSKFPDYILIKPRKSALSAYYCIRVQYNFCNELRPSGPVLTRVA